MLAHVSAQCEDPQMALAAGIEHDGERLPASLRYLAPRLAVAAFLIVITWQTLGARPGAIVAAVLGVVYAVFIPRALLLDGEGFQVIRCWPRKKVLWTSVESFGTGYAARGGSYVSYTKTARRPRWWYPAGWPAQGSIVPAFGLERGRPALSADELCGLLNSRLAGERNAPSPEHR